MRKRFGLAILFLGLCVGYSHATDLFRSSTTATTDKDKVLCGGGSRAMLYGVVVSSGAGTLSNGDMVSVFNSSFTTTGTTFVGPIDTRAPGTYYYSAGFPKGILYTSTGTAVKTLLYQCY